MKTAIVIPARYASQRLPGKPLLKATGKYLIQHVYEQAQKSERASHVVVATDDPRIAAAVQSFGGSVELTRRDHLSGTDRIAELADHLEVDVVVNLQGDEPLVSPAALDLLPDLLENDPNADIATLAAPITSKQQWLDTNCVKVVRDRRGRALYFSRSPIPYVRDGEPDFTAQPPAFLQHLGLYAYRRTVLFRLAMEPPDQYEQQEKLEQLRAMALGFRIAVGVVPQASCGVDTREDYERFVSVYQQREAANVPQAA